MDAAALMVKSTLESISTGDCCAPQYILYYIQQSAGVPYQSIVHILTCASIHITYAKTDQYIEIKKKIQSRDATVSMYPVKVVYTNSTGMVDKKFMKYQN